MQPIAGAAMSDAMATISDQRREWQSALDRLFRLLAFDWDGKAVVDRHENAGRTIPVLEQLLGLGVPIVVITGTSLGNIERPGRGEQVEAPHAETRLDSLTYATRKTLDENRAKLSAEVTDHLTRALDEAQRLGDAHSDDLEALKSAEQALMQASHKMAEELYRPAGGPQGGGGQQGGGGGAEPGVVDAEYEEHLPST
jgi:hypothetical protein